MNRENIRKLGFLVTSYKEGLIREEKIEIRWIVSAFSMPSKPIITLLQKFIVFVCLESPYTIASIVYDIKVCLISVC